jgi:peptide/nickel transport system permease protein
MLALLGRRIVSAIVLTLVVTALAFWMIHANAHEIARNILGPEATADAVTARETQLGLNRPVVVQYLDWLRHAVTGDLGVSYFTYQPVSSALAAAVPVTLSVIVLSTILTAIVSVVLGVASARRGGPFDRVVQVGSVVGLAIPHYLRGLALVLLVALPLPMLFPATGYVDPAASVTGWVASITLPAIALTIGGVAAVAQQVRGSMIDALRQDYIRTLRSRGISERMVTYRHALRNAAGPALIVLSLQFVGLLGGAIIIEQVFALPGVGQMAINASLRGDVPMVMGVIAFTVLLVVVVNLVIDLLTGQFNPKARMR